MFIEEAGNRPHASSASALGASVTAHVLLGALAFWIVTGPASSRSLTNLIAPGNHGLVWIDMSGPGGGGGGGGNRTRVAAPARQPGRDRMTVRVATSPSEIEPSAPPPLTPLLIPARAMAAGVETTPGTIEPGSIIATTLGPGTGGGAGDGRGPGSGPGDGAGAGPGLNRGMGNGIFHPGAGVSSPELVRQVRPHYTAAAMRARLQGVVRLECVVLPDGTVGDVRIVRSLDRAFGLDEEAVAAARQWRFIPGRRFGEAVPVLVTIELTFNLH